MRISERKEIEVNEKKYEYMVVEFDTDTKDLIDILPEPSFEDAMDDDDDIFDSFVDWSNDGSYICDVISELADSQCDVYNSDLWKNAYNVQEYIEQAISEGLVDTSDFDLTRCFSAGEYEYYTAALYDNLDILCVRWMEQNVIKGTKFALIMLTDTEIKATDLTQEFLDKLSDAFDEYKGDDNYYFYVLEEDANEMIDDILTDITDDYEEDGIIFTRLEDEDDTDDFEEQIQEWLDNHEEDED